MPRGAPWPVAVDLTYRNVRKVGPALDMENGKFFDFDTAGRFKRVRFWTGTFIDQKASIAAARKAA